MIRQNVIQILSELPDGVQVVAAAKTRPPADILEAIEAGIKIVGENYIQEAEKAYEVVGRRAEWHFIGSLQKNKVKRAVGLFDMIETVGSMDLAAEIDKRCAQSGKVMPVLIEVNSGREDQKSGVFPENAEQLVRQISSLHNIRIMGLMTMGPRSGAPEDFRPYFAETRKIFEKVKSLGLPNMEMKYLSMGMTDSYKVAIEEGANLVRIGTRLFGERSHQF
jgi:pyridoxal phosphate enzyme (YggS family)